MADAPAPAEKPARKPRRWLRRLGLLAVVLLALVWFAPTLLAKLGLLNGVVTRATAKLKGNVSIGSASLGWFSPVTLHDVKLTDEAGETVATLPAVRSSHSLLGLARNPADLGTFMLDRPEVQIVGRQGTTNLEQVLAAYLEDPSPTTGARPAVAVAVTDGTLVIRDGDRDKSWTVTGVDATVTLPAGSEPIHAKVKGQFDGGGLDADVSVGPSLAVRLKTENFPLEAAAVFARRVEPELTATGRLSADVETTTIPGTTPTARVSGSLTVADLDLGSPRLGGERFKLSSVHLPCRVETVAGIVRVETADLTCDVGQAHLSGRFDPAAPPAAILDQPGVDASVEIDVAKLATMFPKLLRVRDGTALTEGRVTAKLVSRSTPAGVVWDGQAGTSALRGVRDGKPLAWDQPLTVSFAGRLSKDGLPAFERLEARSEFATASGSGTVDQFTLQADASLDRLTARLSDFLDLRGLRLAGTAKLGVTGKTVNGRSEVGGTLRLTNLDFSDGVRRFQEPDLTTTFSLDGAFLSAASLNAATLRVTAGTETALLQLLEPITDLKAVQTGKAEARVTGDLERWVARASSFVPLPKNLRIGGKGTVGGVVTVTADTLSLDKLTADLRDARFHGYGLKLDEPQLVVSPTTGTVVRKTGLVEFPTLVVQTQTLAASVQPLKLVPLPEGSYGVELAAAFNASLARVQQALQLQTDPQLADRIDGVVTNGRAVVKAAGTAYTFDATLPVQKLVLGHPQRPAWAEEKVTVVAKGAYDLVADNLQLDRGVVERPDGLKVDAAGRIDRATTVADIDLSGKLTYDLAVVEPQLKKFLGQSFQVVGKDTRDFKLAGRLSAGVDGLAVGVARGKTSPFGQLNGNASLAWQSLKAYGFDVGQSQLSAKLDKGVMTIDPLEASFGQTGKVRLEPTVRFLPTGNEVTLAKGKVIDKAKLTPQACADALGYVLPVFARSTETQGTISFDLDDNRVPLADPEKGTMKGKLTLHEVQIGPGPVLREIATLLGAKNTTFSLNKDNKPQEVPIRFENGWVHHENLTLATKNFTMTTSGAVSVTGELNMVADVPLPEDSLGLLKNNPKIRDALANRRVKVPLRGTVGKPQLDPKAFQLAIKQVTDEVVKDVGKNALGGLLDKIPLPQPKKP